MGIGTGGPWGKPQAKRCTLNELRDAVEFIKKFTAGEEVVYKGMKMKSEYSRRQFAGIHGFVADRSPANWRVRLPMG